jgi:hypothetical protein
MSTTTDTTRPKSPVFQQAEQPRRRWSFLQRVCGQYWRIARRRRVLDGISRLFRDALTISPLQCEEAVTRLVALRRAVDQAHQFYCTLDQEKTKHIRPWGAIAKLQDVEYQVTELLLHITAMQEAVDQGQVLIRVQVHLMIRQLFPVLVNSFEDLTSQLGALLEKAQGGQA